MAGSQPPAALRISPAMVKGDSVSGTCRALFKACFPALLCAAGFSGNDWQTFVKSGCDAQALEHHLQFPLGRARRDRALGAGRGGRTFAVAGITENSRVINLRGNNPDYGWWRYETQVCAKSGRRTFRRHAGFAQIADAAMLTDLFAAFDACAAPVAGQMLGRAGSHESRLRALPDPHARLGRARAGRETILALALSAFSERASALAAAVPGLCAKRKSRRAGRAMGARAL